MEFVRCVICVAVAHHVRDTALFTLSFAGVVEILFLASAALWGVLTLLQYNVHMITKKVD